jgi:hypothetical protein
MTIIEIRAFRNGGQMYQASGVQPSSPVKSEIRVLKSNGTVARSQIRLSGIFDSFS